MKYHINRLTPEGKFIDGIVIKIRDYSSFRIKFESVFGKKIIGTHIIEGFLMKRGKLVEGSYRSKRNNVVFVVPIAM